MKKETAKRIRELEEHLEALVIAIPKEEAAHRFYLDLAGSARHEGAKKMFLSLAGQELEHKHKLESLSTEIRDELSRLKAGKKK